MLRTRSLPGVTFTTVTPPVDGLPRMDVAAFVGFASSGPINVPVAIEDVAGFESVFGPAPRLAWDAECGIWQTAYLAAAVRDFFEQGGRRCWVVRVAATDEDKGAAVNNTFPIPGLLHASAGNLVPAIARARSEGSWSDNLRVRASLLVDEVAFDGHEVAQAGYLSLRLSVMRGSEFEVGDLVRLDFDENVGGWTQKTVAYLYVESVEPPAKPYRSTGQLQTVEGAAYWFREVVRLDNHLKNGRVQIETPDGPGASAVVTLEPQDEERNKTVLMLNIDPVVSGNVEFKPDKGSWLTFTPTNGAGRMWLFVDDEAHEEGRYRHTWWEDAAGTIGKMVRASRLTMALEARDDKTRSGWTLLDLRFSAPHPRFWGYLPHDRSFYTTAPGFPEVAAGNPSQALWQNAENPRFPLAGPVEDDSGGVFIPLGLGIGAVAWGEMVEQEKSPLMRDGLVPAGSNYPSNAFLTGKHWAKFLQSIFLDTRLRWSRGEALLAEAFDRQFVQNKPVSGLHSIFALEDVSLLALPDAVHRGWRIGQPELQPEIFEPEPEQEEPEICAGHEQFRPKIPALIEGPLDYIDQDEGWVWVAETAYRLTDTSQIADGLESGDVVVVEMIMLEGRVAVVAALKYKEETGTLDSVSGNGDEVVVDGQPPYTLADTIQANTDYINRMVSFIVTVRFRYLDDGTTVVMSIRLADVASGGQKQPSITPQPPDDKRWELLPAREIEPKNLLEIHKGAIGLAAARADMVAILGMPEYFLADDALDYHGDLVGWLRSEQRSVASYAALYHPWLVARDANGQLHSHGPEGAVCGIIAARSLARGAWVPPANDQVRDALALRPAISDEEQAALYNAQINLIRANPDGFVLWGADTLSDDPDLMALNVRRLLILLRRLALREGQTYTFEPNSPDFRRLVASNFERRLATLYTRGAFAGEQPSDAYRVVIDETINTHWSIEQGRLIVELRVAPSQPLVFIAVRLLQTDAGTLAVQEG